MADTPDTSVDPSQNNQFKIELRKELRQRRSALTPAQQTQSSSFALRHLLQFAPFMRSAHIGLYLANDGELDPSCIAKQLWQMNKYCYLPVMRPGANRELWFLEYRADTVLTPNRFGIPEPDHRSARRLPTYLLDVVLMPLVGFDRTGARLGMGGGFYDTTFAFKRTKPKGKPLLIGLAHSCQEADSIPLEEWDIPLAAIATEKEVIPINC